MKKILLLEIFDSYDVEDNIINRNCIKCLLKSMIKKEMCSIEGQYYLYDDKIFSWLISIYKELSIFFDFHYSLKSDLILMFTYLIDNRVNNEKISFNAFFCPGYNDKGGYKDYLGNTTIKKLAILNDIASFLKKNNIQYEIHCYYCDSYIENCNDNINKNWYDELVVNRNLFKKECQKYFKDSSIHYTSELDIFKNEKSYAGHIDYDIINKISSKEYRSFYIANEVFYKKLDFSKERIKERNDTLATMYILVSDYINSLRNGIYLPMENMYDREKIIANNNTCTMYLNQKMVKKYE